MQMNLDVKKSFIQRAIPNRNQNSAANKCKHLISKPLYQFVLLGIVIMVLKLVSIMLPSVLPSTYLNVVASMMVYSIMAVGFCLLLGYSGLASLGTAGFVGVGAYIAFYTMQEWGLPYIATFVIALIVSIILGISIGFISLRIEGIYLAIITLGLSEVMRYALKAIYSGVIKVTNRNLKLFGLQVGSDGMFFIVCIMLIALLIITSNLINSPTGRAMLAMKNSTSAAQAYGISLLKFRLLAFVIATVFATLAGTAWLLAGNAMSPSSEAEIMLKITLSLNILGAVIIGGYKSIWGVMFGVFFVFGLGSILTLILPYQIYEAINPYISLFIGVLMILVVMFFPGGVAQIVSNARLKKALKNQQRRLYDYESK